MATVTLTTLVARVRERADMPVAGFVTDTATSLWSFINEAHAKLHGMLVDALGEEYVSSSTPFTTVANQSDYALPATFYKLYGVDLDYHGLMRALKQYNRAERNLYRELHPEYTPRYQLVGSSLRLYPAPAAGLTGAILYAPEATVLAASNDTVTYPNGWERFIVIDAAIQALLKEESSVTQLVAERAAIIREIEATKELRDLATPHQVVDVNNLDNTIEEWW
jgi:hypothetical protein